MAEIVQHFYPRVVEVHNYVSAHSIKKKTYNWNTLKMKVLSRLRFAISETEIEKIAQAKAGYIQAVLVRFMKFAKSRKYEKRIRRQKAKESRIREQPGRHTHLYTIDDVGPAPRNIEDLQKELLQEKDHKINELEHTIRIMLRKIDKLEALMQLKDSKIAALATRLRK